MARKTKVNDITNPELLKQVNPENTRLVNDYISYLKSTQKAETTIKVYRNDLDIAMVWCLRNNSNKFFINWTKRDIVSFQNWLINENENSAARVRRIKATLSSMSNFVENILDDEYPDFRNIIHKVENPVNQPTREKTVLEDEQLEDLLNELVNKKKYEKACMLALAMSSGRRKSELVRFKVSYFDDKNIILGSLYKTPEKVRTKGRGNGKYIHCYTLVSRFKPYLDLWLEERSKKGIDSEWLFPMPEDSTKHIKAETLNSWANTFTRILGVPFYFHCLRHYFVTYLIKAGIPEDVVTEIIAWDSAEMCRLYTDLSTEDRISEYFSADGIVNKGTTKLENL